MSDCTDLLWAKSREICNGIYGTQTLAQMANMLVLDGRCTQIEASTTLAAITAYNCGIVPPPPIGTSKTTTILIIMIAAVIAYYYLRGK